MKQLGDMNEVKTKLQARGWSSVAAWARAHGYLPVTVRRTVYDWGRRVDRDPLGGIGRQIIRDLRRTLDEQEVG
jgi:hypothetical protein